MYRKGADYVHLLSKSLINMKVSKRGGGGDGNEKGQRDRQGSRGASASTIQKFKYYSSNVSIITLAVDQTFSKSGTTTQRP